MKIALDPWVLTRRLRYHGMHVYAQNLIAQFKSIARVRPEITFCLFVSPQVANDVNSVEPSTGFELRPSGLLGRDRLWRLGGVNLAAACAHADVVFSPTAINPVGPVPMVCTLHDAIPALMPVHSQRVRLALRSLMWSAARFSRAIITVSECSKRDLVSTYQLPESKVSVIYSGYDPAVFNDDAPDPGRHKSLQRLLGLDRAYIFHHGVIQPRKNLKRLIQAHRLMLSKNRNLELDLVLAGRLGWEYDEVLAAIENGTNPRGRAILTGPLEDSDLATLIKASTLVVIPSLYEGFCLPMLEAMACGVPTIVSHSSCLPEISGGALKYFDPLSVEDMVSCMEQVMESEETRRDLARRGKLRASQFSWRRCAEQTLDVLARHCES